MLTYLKIFIGSLIFLAGCINSENSGTVDSNSSGDLNSEKSVTSLIKSSSSLGFTGVFDTIVDVRNGKTYKIVFIGSQVWMAENLNIGTFIPDSNYTTQYLSGIQKFCYENNTLNCEKEGGLYQWHTVMAYGKSCIDGSRSCGASNEIFYQGICPTGWHLPREEDWNLLKETLWGEGNAGRKMKKIEFKGDNTSGFSAILTGHRDSQGGFSNRGHSSTFWGNAAQDMPNWATGFSAFAWTVNLYSDYLEQYGFETAGFSVRCLKN